MGERDIFQKTLHKMEIIEYSWFPHTNQDRQYNARAKVSLLITWIKKTS
jgi:hypothetical protein